jgi:cytochrome c oxidase subunit 2
VREIITPPLQYLSGAGSKAAPVVALTWGMLAISIAVILIVAGLLAAAIWRRPSVAEIDPAALREGVAAHNWLWIGVSFSALALLITVVWTVKVLADIQAPSTNPSITIEVMGRQWWWQVRYIGANPAEGFATANEIHIPTGQTIRLKLVGGDVIHSFWVPQLGGKMDAIPGQINETWLEADIPGTFTGQCTEYCGVQHSKMLLRVVAQMPADFHAWWEHQLAPASGDARVFVTQCGGCHTMRGTEARGTLGPDLSHLMQRQTLASAVLPNDEEHLSRWITNPQSLKPGNLMPAVTLTRGEHDQIMTFLKMQQ